VLPDDWVLEKLAADGFDPGYVARPLHREGEPQVENYLAMMIITGACPDGNRVRDRIAGGQFAFRAEPLGLG
jgi:ATP-dependent Clp protease ATP-binding subunit ClpA